MAVRRQGLLGRSRCAFTLLVRWLAGWCLSVCPSVCVCWVCRLPCLVSTRYPVNRDARYPFGSKRIVEKVAQFPKISASIAKVGRLCASLHLTRRSTQLFYLCVCPSADLYRRNAVFVIARKKRGQWGSVDLSIDLPISDRPSVRLSVCLFVCVAGWSSHGFRDAGSCVSLDAHTLIVPVPASVVAAFCTLNERTHTCTHARSHSLSRSLLPLSLIVPFLSPSLPPSLPPSLRPSLPPSLPLHRWRPTPASPTTWRSVAPRTSK
jgi:hypothetical protein